MFVPALLRPPSLPVDSPGRIVYPLGMKTRALFSLFLLLSLQFPLTAKSRSGSIAAIDAMLTAWHHAAAVADEKGYFDSLLEDAVFIGTDPGERWTKPEFRLWAAPAFRRESAWVFKARERNIRLAPGGRLAWFDELLYSKSFWTSRGSGVVLFQGGRWRIAHYVLSFTVPNGAVQRIRPLLLEEPSRETPREETKR